MCMVQMKEVNAEECAVCPAHEEIMSLKEIADKARNEAQSFKIRNCELQTILVEYAIKKIREE